MSLAAGTRLGTYEVVEPLGQGGMGEVYRARDSRLKRDVALKLLPSSVASDRDRVARFEREAELLAALNHPNIGNIYGVEADGGTIALVLELVDGEDLTARIARGPMPLDEVLPIARQVADALETAHDRGIIHRDLKPANIKVRPDGTVKVLDFGLAKATEPGVGPAHPGEGGGPGVGDGLVSSPTVTSPAMTRAGIILGTAAYMAPEQARGQAVDRRADVWAFGAVLFEMLAGVRPFAGDNVPDLLASVLRAEPDWSRLPPDLPDSVQTLLRRCLEKDVRRRLSHLSVATFLLSDDVAARSVAPSTAHPAAGTRHPVVTAAAALVAGAAIAGAVSWWLPSRGGADAVKAPVRFTIVGGETSRVTTDRPFALSPDARALVYRGRDAATGIPQLFVRRLDSLEPQPIADSALARAPFLSPDGQWVGFFAGAELRKVRVSGGPAVAVARASPAGDVVAGASWGDDDSIVFGFVPTSRQGLMIVPASGGEPTALTTVDPDADTGHTYPFVLPGSRGVLLTEQKPGRPLFDGRIVVLDRASGVRREIASSGGHAEYVDGHVVYSDPLGRLYGVPFDVARLEPRGAPRLLAEQVQLPANGQPMFSSALAGALAVVPDTGTGDSETSRLLVWVDRQGREEPTAAPPRAYALPRVSPDGTRIALDIRQQENDIWVWSTDRNALTRLTIGPALDMSPIWTPDGRRIVWASTRDGTNPVLYWQAADGTGTPERLGRQGLAQFPSTVTPDGRSVLFFQGGNASNSVLERLLLQGGHGCGDRPARTEPAPDTRGVAGWPLAGVLIGRVRPAGDLCAALSRRRGRSLADLLAGRDASGMEPERTRFVLPRRRGAPVGGADRHRRRPPRAWRRPPAARADLLRRLLGSRIAPARLRRVGGRAAVPDDQEP